MWSFAIWDMAVKVQPRVAELPGKCLFSGLLAGQYFYMKWPSLDHGLLSAGSLLFSRHLSYVHFPRAPFGTSNLSQPYLIIINGEDVSDYTSMTGRRIEV